MPAVAAQGRGAFEGDRSCLVCGKQGASQASAQLPVQSLQPAVISRSHGRELKQEPCHCWGAFSLSCFPPTTQACGRALGAPGGLLPGPSCLPLPCLRAQGPGRDQKASPPVEKAAPSLMPVSMTAPFQSGLAACWGRGAKRFMCVISFNPRVSCEVRSIINRCFADSKLRQGQRDAWRFQERRGP